MILFTSMTRVTVSLPDSLRLFTNPVANITGFEMDYMISMVSFKCRMFIIPGIRISAGQEGIIYMYYITYKKRIYELDLYYDYVGGREP